MKPTYFFQAYQFPLVGDVLTSRQIDEKITKLCTAEVWAIDAREPTAVEYTAWKRDGEFITAYDLNGELRYVFRVRQVFIDRYVVDEASWA